jgi:hypothetical protein
MSTFITSTPSGVSTTVKTFTINVLASSNTLYANSSPYVVTVQASLEDDASKISSD